MRWINFLHLYQPMNAEAAVIKEATEKSYYRIVRALEENPQIKFTLNISGCLLMRWDELGFNDLIIRIAKLLKEDRIELTGSAAYHALLPLVPAEEAKRQIAENEAIIKKYFSNYQPRGFFLPEMAYSRETAKIVKNFGYQWIILDEIAYNGKLNQAAFHKIYEDKNSGLKIIFRSRALSKNYVPDVLKREPDNNKLFITATDAELYGLRHIDHTAELEKILKNKELKTQTISEFIDTASTTEKIIPLACSWESMEKELKEKNPFALWNDKTNKIQQGLWRLAKFAYQIAASNQEDKNYLATRWHLVRGLASCTFWWASGRNLGPFSPIAWNPDEIEKGINELIRAIRSLENKKLNQEKIKAEKMCAKLREQVWAKHWHNY